MAEVKEEEFAPKTLMYIIIAVISFIVILAIFFLIRQRLLK